MQWHYAWRRCRCKCLIIKVAEGVRFELTRPFGLPVFKTGAINRSATPPGPFARSETQYSIAPLLQVKSRRTKAPRSRSVIFRSQLCHAPATEPIERFRLRFRFRIGRTSRRSPQGRPGLWPYRTQLPVHPTAWNSGVQSTRQVRREAFWRAEFLLTMHRSHTENAAFRFLAPALHHDRD
jgi:hypothetical protein